MIFQQEMMNRFNKRYEIILLFACVCHLPFSCSAAGLAITDNNNAQLVNQMTATGGVMPSSLNMPTLINNITQQQQQTGSKFNANNVLEALSSMGKAIQQQVAAAQFQIAPANNEFTSGNTRKNKYQAIEQVPANGMSVNNNSLTLAPNYREQGEILRQEIGRRAGHLQQVVGSSLEMLKNNSDLIVRRLLEQLNHRLDQAKSRADKIINEPATNELAIRALTTINLGLNNLNTMINNIVTRLEASAREANANPQTQQRTGNGSGIGTGTGNNNPISQLDPVKLRASLQQLREHFSSAVNVAHQQQRQLQLQLAQTQSQSSINRMNQLQQLPVLANQPAAKQ